MYTEKQIKGHAKALRKALAARNLELSHAQSLELLAETLGEKSWNHLSAKLDPLSRVVQENEIPDGWSFIGREYHECYKVGVEKGEQSRHLVIECVNNRADAFASLMQHVASDKYCDHHVRFSAEVKTIESGPASLWARVDGRSGAVLAFDNMVDVAPYRALEGTNEWTLLELVIDVPEGAVTVNFGCMLSGKGMAKFRYVSFDAVDRSVPVSGGRSERSIPTNLGFE